MIYKIPTDNGHPWRLQKFIELHANSDIYADYKLMRQWAEDNELNFSKKIWLCIAYSIYRCASSAIFTVRKLTLAKLKETSIVEAFGKIYSPHLAFGSKREYIRQHNYFADMCMGLQDKINEHGTFTYWINSLVDENNPKRTYDNMFAEFISIPHFGQYSAKILVETIVNMTDIKAELTDIRWTKADTAAMGMLLILYRDIEAIDYNKRRVILPDTVKQMKQAHKAIIMAIEQTTSASTSNIDLLNSLVEFYNLFKKRTYIGFWIDKQLEELNRNKHDISIIEGKTRPPSSSWAIMLDLRQTLFNDDQLGENNGWDGIRAERKKDFTNMGRLL